MIVMNAKAERKARSHEAILASAAKLLRERGIGGTSVAEVMAGAGLTVGGFYAHFASKEALIETALKNAMTELKATLVEGLEDLAPNERVALVLDRYLTAEHRDAPAKGCPLPAVAGELASREEPNFRVAMGEAFSLFVSELERLAPGSLVERRNRAVGAAISMVGALVLARATRGSVLSDEILSVGRQCASEFLAPPSSRTVSVMRPRTQPSLSAVEPCAQALERVELCAPEHEAYAVNAG